MSRQEGSASSSSFGRAPMNVLRRWRLLEGKAKDHEGEAVLVENPNFQIKKTVFGTVDFVKRQAVAARLRLEPFWCDAVAVEVLSQSLPRAPAHDAALLDFMTNECDFAMEHADGSFSDHLQFVYEYASHHYSKESPRVLLLHSILGVGTNYFPCDAAKIPDLQKLLSDREFAHVQAFPTVLRLIMQQDFMDVLENVPDLSFITGLEMHRVIDNAKISLDSSEDFWVHLNYQLIHLLDFLPVLDWAHEAKKDNFLFNFIRLLALLKKANQLRAVVDLDGTTVQNLSSTKAPPGKQVLASISLGGFITNYLPSNVQLKLAAQQVKTFSNAIGHSLHFDLRVSSGGAPAEDARDGHDATLAA